MKTPFAKAKLLYRLLSVSETSQRIYRSKDSRRSHCERTLSPLGSLLDSDAFVTVLARCGMFTFASGSQNPPPHNFCLLSFRFSPSEWRRRHKPSKARPWQTDTQLGKHQWRRSHSVRCNWTLQGRERQREGMIHQSQRGGKGPVPGMSERAGKRVWGDNGETRGFGMWREQRPGENGSKWEKLSMINGERARCGEQGDIGGGLYMHVYVWVCGVRAHTILRPPPPCVCVCVCPNRFSLCHLQALPPPAASGIFVFACSVLLKRGSEKNTFFFLQGDTRSRAAYLTQNRKSAAFLTSLAATPLPPPSVSLFKGCSF